MVLVRGIVGPLLGLLFAHFGVASSAAALTPESTVAAHTYDNTHISPVTADAAAERGPPASPDRHITYVVDDLLSQGTPARPNRALAGYMTTYTGPAGFVRVALANGATWTRVQSQAGGLSSPDRAGVAANSGPSFIASADGVIVPTSRARLESGFNVAGFPSTPTSSPGMQYALPDGSLVRIMEPSGQAPLRASFTNAADGPISPFTGNPVQPPPGLTAAERRDWVRSRTHVELGP